MKMPPKKLSQNEMILILASKGWITPLLALQEAGCLRLGARLWELKAEGYEFEEKWMSHESRFGKKTYKAFRLWGNLEK